MLLSKNQFVIFKQCNVYINKIILSNTLNNALKNFIQRDTETKTEVLKGGLAINNQKKTMRDNIHERN